MKVILLEDVENVGKAGDVVDVSDGYARNSLFPRGVAAQATDSRVREAEQRKAKAEELQVMALEEAQRHIEILDGKTILLRVNAGPEGTLFGAVTAKDITEEIQRSLGVALPKGIVRLKEPIKLIGEKPVHLEFPHGLEADMTVIVEPRRGEDADAVPDTAEQAT